MPSGFEEAELEDAGLEEAVLAGITFAGATDSGVRRRAFVDLDAIVENARLLAGTDSIAAVLVDLRADAYGHGLTRVADALATAGALGFIVSTRSEYDQLALRFGSLLIRHGAPAPEDAALHILGPSVFGVAAPSPSAANTLRAALCLVAEAVAVKPVKANIGVSYGYTYRTTSETTLVLAGLGYADGVPRIASNRSPVLVGTTTAKVTGRIAMDQFVVDIGDAGAHVGDDVVLFGAAERGEPTILQWAATTGLRPEVIVAGLGPRIERVYENR